MEWTDRCCLARVRMLAIAEEVAAGGAPSDDRIRHALAPIVDHFVAGLAAAAGARARRSPAPRRQDGSGAAQKKNCR